MRVEIPSSDGKIETTFDVKRSGNIIHIRRQGLMKPWSVSIMDTFVQAGEKDDELNIHLT